MTTRLLIGAALAVLLVLATLHLLDLQRDPPPRGLVPGAHGPPRSISASEALAPLARELTRVALVAVPEEVLERPAEVRRGAVTEASPIATDDLLEVLVQDRSGLPVEGAEVEVRPLGWAQPRARARTDPGGLARVRAAAGERLRIVALGHAALWHTLIELPLSGRIAFTLVQGVTVLRARIVDDLGARIAGARIQVHTENLLDLTGESDADGTIALSTSRELADRIQAYIEVEHPQYCWLLSGVPIELETGESLRELVLHRPAVLRVRALAPDGEPLVGVTARSALSSQLQGEVEPVAFEQARFHLFGVAHARARSYSNPDFEVRRLPPGLPLALIVSHPEYEPLEIELGVLQPGEVREVSRSFRAKTERSRLSIRVVDDDGRGIVGASLSWRADADDDWSGAQTDANGRARIEPPSPPWRLAARAPGHAPVELVFSTSEDTTRELEVALIPSTRSIRVRLVDTEGGVVLRAVLNVSEEASLGKAARTWGWSAPDAEGLVTLDSLAEGRRYRIDLGDGRPGGYWGDPDRTGVPEPSAIRGARLGDEIELRIVPPASLGGKVESDGVAGKALLLTCFDPELQRHGLRPDNFTRNAPLNEDGSFLFTGLPSGRYRIWSRELGAPKLEHPLLELDLARGEDRRGVIIRLP